MCVTLVCVLWYWLAVAVLCGARYVGSFDGNLYAFDVCTGGLAWSRGLGGKVEASAAIGPGRQLYVGSDARFFALRSD